MMSALILILSIIQTILICLFIYFDKYSPVLIYWWLASISFLILSTFVNKKILLPRLHLSIKKIFILSVILLPVFVRIANYHPGRMHSDEALTAFFSATEDFSKVNFFGGIPSDKTQWQSQYPGMFFVLQKLFFIVFGESYLTVKLSITPYIFLVSIMLFLITKIIFDEKTAIIALILYAFFPISIYFETIGIHVITSTAIFLVFFYFIILQLKSNKGIYSVLTGICCGFNYLFYVTSYIALPIMLFSYIIQLIKKRRIDIFKNFILAFIGFIIVLSPFIVYALKFDNYFVKRINQVSILDTPTSKLNQNNKLTESIISLKKNAINSFKSFYLDGIGGAGGYDFGHLAIFERSTLLIFITGVIIGSLFLLRKIEMLFVLIIIFISFTAIALAIPPPAYHHFALAFPFITIILSLPFFVILSLNKISSYIRYFVIIFLLGVYIFNNETYFLKSIEKERDNIDIKLSNYINENFSGRNIYIAAFPGFHFEKVYYFSPGKNARLVKTDYHDSLLGRFNFDEKYVYVIIFPGDFNEKFKKADPNGKIITFDDFYSLFVN